MTHTIRDPLLLATQKLLRFCYFVIFAAAVLTVLMPILGLILGDHVSQYAQHLPTEDRGGTFLFLSAAPLLVMYGLLLRLLTQIVDTVAAGTPFVAANADRLARMGWLALLLKLVVLAESSLLHTTAARFVRFGAGFSGPGLLAALVLFILARVFRQGAAMREDLEGTV